ncbi:extracellular solute-binding protein [Fodinicola feengrottensis]|uniref:extracellular solute-binding protein n=1 Tax=Fodinicola feengrottensis TaxID=435914 RepID=UPI0013D6494E|nr:extracellular solute-binding protein [Fodinicola feengrottensis]
MARTGRRSTRPSIAAGFPRAKVTINGGQQLKQQLQPRFVGGNPPDLTATNDLDLPALVQQGQLMPLDQLLQAPSFDTPGKTVAQTLLPGVTTFGTLDGKIYAHPYVDGMSGIWYSQPLLDQHGWQYPHTWDEMMALCAKIKAAGIAPWTYQGKYPGYIVNPMLNIALKAAGMELGRTIDNLAPNAWKDPALLATATRFHELAAKGYLLEGTTGLTHTQAQTYWAQRKAVFIPCGSWLENELGDIAPKDLGMTVNSPPSLSANEKMPFEAVQVNVGGDFAVPTKAKNPRWAAWNCSGSCFPSRRAPISPNVRANSWSSTATPTTSACRQPSSPGVRRSSWPAAT